MTVFIIETIFKTWNLWIISEVAHLANALVLSLLFYTVWQLCQLDKKFQVIFKLNVQENNFPWFHTLIRNVSRNPV